MKRGLCRGNLRISKGTLYQIHLVLGIGFGAILSLVGISGALYGFEREIRLSLGETIQSGSLGERLGAPVLRERLFEQGVDALPFRFIWDERADTPVWVEFSSSLDRLDSRIVMIDPYTGQILPRHTRLRSLSLGLLEFHRTLLLGEFGRRIVGFSAIALGLLIISGLLYSVPRGLRLWEAFQVRNFRNRPVKWGRWHRSLGWWLSPVLLLSVGTGLFWSFSSYRSFIHLITFSQQPAPAPVVAVGLPTEENVAPLDRLWSTLALQIGESRAMRLQLPLKPGEPVIFQWQPPESPFTSARSTVYLHPQSASILRVDPVSEFSWGTWLYRAAYPLHTGLWGGLPAQLLMVVAGLSMPFFTITGFWLFFRHRQKRRQPHFAVPNGI